MNTKISNFFIDNYFSCTNPSYILVYILLLRLCEDNKCEISAAADSLQVMESDIRRALLFWAKKGEIMYHEENGLLYVEFSAAETDKKPEYKMPAVAVSRPIYTPQEILHCMERSNSLRDLFKVCAGHMGKLLSDNDMCVLFGFLDWLRFSPEMVELLVEYCCSNEHRSIRYIEKVAVTWADAGIDTPEKARERIKLYNSDFRRVMRALGKTDREPVKAEEAFMLKWLKTYKMPIEVVEAACERTVLQSSRPTFKYADGIIGNWYAAGVMTVDDIELVENEFKAGREKTAEKNKAGKGAGGKTKPKKTKFSNFKERENTDFSEIQRLEMERIDRELGESGER